MSQRKITILTTLLAFFVVAAAAILAAESSAAGNTAAGHTAVSAWLEAWNNGIDNLDSFLSEDFTFKDPFYSSASHQGYMEIIATGRSAFSDLEFKADELIRDGDRGALTWTVTATHNMTGRVVAMQGVSILCFEGEKMAAEWRLYDVAELARQLGGTVTFPDDGGGDRSN